MSRLGGDGSPTQLFRLACSTKREQRGSMVAPERRPAALACSAIEPFQRLLTAPLRVQRERQHVFDVRQHAVALEQAAITCFGPGKIAGALQRHRGAEFGLDCIHEGANGIAMARETGIGDN